MTHARILPHPALSPTSLARVPGFLVFWGCEIAGNEEAAEKGGRSFVVSGMVPGTGL